MNIETEVEGEHIERKQRTGAELFGPANALVVPDVVSGSAFGAVVPRVKRILASSHEIEEYILSEYDPILREKLRALYARRDRVRAELKRLGERLSKSHYSRLIQEFTNGYQRIKVVVGWKDVSAYEWSIKHGRWKTIQDEERITRTEFYERLLKYASLSSSARRSAFESLRQSRISDDEARRNGSTIEKNYVWRTNPRTIRVRNNPLFDGFNQPIPEGSNLHDIMMAPEPVYGTKKVPNTDWDAVRHRWSIQVGEIQPKQEALLSELWDIERQLDELRPASSHRFNRCVQLSATPLVVPSRNVRLLSSWDYESERFPSLPMELPDGSVRHSWLPGDVSVDLTFSTNEHVYAVPELVSNQSELEQSLFMIEDGCRNYHSTGIYPEIPPGWEDIGPSRSILHGLVTAFATISDAEHPIHYTRIVPEPEPNVPLPLSSRFAGEHVGNPIRVDSKIGADAVDERIQTSLNALLAGRASGSEDVSFNMARSLGELKDLPQTGSQSADFAAWLLRPDAREGLYAFRVKGHKKPLYAPLRYFDRKTNLLNGIKIASYKAVRRTPTLAMLASAYLGWKFAIEPTISDINRVQRELMSDLLASRRYVTRLYRKLDATVKSVVLRRGFLVGTPVKRDKSLSAADVLDRRHDIPYRDSLTFTDVQMRALMVYDATPFLVAELEDSSSDGKIAVPYVLTEKGLRVYLWFNTEGTLLSYDARRRCAFDSYSRALDVLPVELYANPCLYHSWVKGCVFARYGRNALSHLANDRSLASKLDRLKIVKTAWDLSPLSFILEWFTNLGDIVQNAQDILSADSVGIMPIGGPWMVATERFAISQSLTPSNWVLCQKLLGASYRPLITTASYAGYPERSYYNARVKLFPVHIEWEWSVIDKITGELINRKKWLDELQPRLVRSRTAVTNRRPMKWERELPSFRPRLRLDYGKGLTLLAMYLAGLRN